MDLNLFVTIAANWELAISVSSLFIAVCAITVSVWQGVVTRKHNRISVTPRLTSWVGTYYEKNRYSVDLMNNGIGPALIEGFTLRVDRKEIAGERVQKMDKALNLLFPNHRYKADYSWLGKNYAMAMGERKPLLEIHFLEPYPTPAEVGAAIDRTEMEINYQCMYGRRFILMTKGMETIKSGPE